MFNPDRVNIHELTIEDPEQQSELPFDPEKEVTAEDLKQIIDEMKEHKRLHSPELVFDIAREVKFFCPTYDLNLNATDWKGMRANLDHVRKQGPDAAYIFSPDAANMKILDPNRNLGLDEIAWRGMRDHLEKCRITNDWRDFSKQAMEMKVLDPNQDLNLDQSAWEGMINELKEDRRSNHWERFACQAMRIKILDPSIKLDLDDDSWEGMKTDLNENRKKTKPKTRLSPGWMSFSSQAMAMTILAAEEVRVPAGGGLEIKMRKDKPIKSEITPLPETKKF